MNEQINPKLKEWCDKIREDEFTVKDITMIGRAEYDGDELMQRFKVGGVEWVSEAYLGTVDDEFFPSLAERKQGALDEVGMTKDQGYELEVEYADEFPS